jgi:hypothetical protein
MNRHLTDAELVDCVDRLLPPERHDHLDRCTACRSRVDALRAMLHEVHRTRSGNVPEPSPLFWDHFSRRVHDAIAEQPAARRSHRIGWWVPTAAALVLGISAVFIWTHTRSSGGLDPAGDETRIATVVPSAPDLMNLDEDVDWGLVRVAADNLEWDAAADAGLHAPPGSAERVAVEMTAVERHELQRLIEAEMKQTGA